MADVGILCHCDALPILLSLTMDIRGKLTLTSRQISFDFLRQFFYGSCSFNMLFLFLFILFKLSPSNTNLMIKAALIATNVFLNRVSFAYQGITKSVQTDSTYQNSLSNSLSGGRRCHVSPIRRPTITITLV